MIGKSDGNLTNLVNTSGFPFQIAISNLIKTTKGEHVWSDFSSEAPWQNPETGRSGYIDLILKNIYDTHLMVIEYKRVRDARWVFLVSSQKQLERRHGKLGISYIIKDKKHFSWLDLYLDPSSPEAEFCVVRGQDKDNKPMLERIASELIDATESIAFEELKFKKSSNSFDGFRRFYSPVIVTTAQLELCILNPDDVSICDGNLTNAEFKTVPLIRFRKSITTSLSPNVEPNNFEQAIKDKIRTVFVINASHLISVLKNWEIDSGSLSSFLCQFS